MAGSMDFRLNLLANTAGLQQGMNGAKFAVNALVAAMAAVGVGLSVQGLAQAADSYTNLSARINIATKDGGNFNQAMAGVHQVALATNSNLSTTADLFARLNTVGKDMGMTQQQTLDLTKTVTQAIKIGGGSAEASEAAVTQFIQAMQGGVLRGEEFNSIMEGGYGLAEALAKGLGVTTGELRKMAEAGELSSERVVKAIGSQAASVQATYDKFPTTISNALQRISTSWEILIGKMDQANGASATVAEWLVMLADNIQYLQSFIDDIGEGFVWIGDKLQSIDASTISTLKSTLSEVYEVVKKNISDISTLGETIWSAFTSALDAVSPLFNALLGGGESVSGLTALLNVLRMAFAGVSDVATGFNIGLKLLLSGIQFLSGGLYALSSQVLGFLGFDTLAQQALSASDRMFAQAEKNGSEAVKLAENHKWAVVQTYEDIGKTEEQKNRESVANNQKKLDQLKTQEEKHKSDYKAISDQKIVLEQQLFEAQTTGNQASIDAATKGLADLDAKEKSYQAESQKITDAKVKAAQDWVIAQLTAADGTQKAADIATQKTLQTTLAAQGLKLEFDSSGKAIVSAMTQAVVAIEAQGNATDKARKAATALGLDLDVSLNRVSEGFKTNATNVVNLASGVELLGAKGQQAGYLTYEAWLKWLATAKSQAEIDLAKQKLSEFGEQGKISTSQVEQGLIAIKLQAQDLPDDINPVTEAFKRLGIETKENLKLAAQQAKMDYITIRDSGQATAEGIQKAYEKAAQAAAISGDAGVIASTNAVGAGRNLEIQMDDTGRAVVTSISQAEQSMNRLSNSVGNAGRSFRGMAQDARNAADEIKNSIDARNDALTARSEAQAKERAESKSSKANGGSFASYSKADVLAELKGMGYDDKEAQKLAGSIMSAAFAKDKDTMQKNMGTGNAAYLNAAFDKLLSQGQTASGGSIEVQKRLAALANGKGSVSVSTPTNSEPASTRRLELVSGGQSATLSGSASDLDAMEKMLSEFEMLKKST